VDVQKAFVVKTATGMDRTMASRIMIQDQGNMGFLLWYYTPVWYYHSFFQEASFFKKSASPSGSYEKTRSLPRGASWFRPRRSKWIRLSWRLPQVTPKGHFSSQAAGKFQELTLAAQSLT
jgi:hypothetical protein